MLKIKSEEALRWRMLRRSALSDSDLSEKIERRYEK